MDSLQDKLRGLLRVRLRDSPKDRLWGGLRDRFGETAAARDWLQGKTCRATACGALRPRRADG